MVSLLYYKVKEDVTVGPLTHAIFRVSSSSLDTGLAPVLCPREFVKSYSKVRSGAQRNHIYYGVEERAVIMKLVMGY